MVFFEILIAVLVFVILFDIYYSLSCLHQASMLVREIDYKGEHTFPSISRTTMNILVDGDSVAAGVGSSAFHRSLAGRVGSHFKKEHTIQLYNNATSGHRVKDMLLKKLPNRKFDLAVISIGSNDLLRLSWIRGFREPVHKMYSRYSQVADTVIVIGPGLVSETSGVLKMIKWLYAFLGPLYGRVMMEEAQDFPNIVHVNPYDKTYDLKAYGKTEAKDHFHPNDQGHKYWYDLFVYGLSQSNFKR